MQELINIAIDIFSCLGPGYNEVIYHRAFEVALRTKGISYQSEVVTPIFYKNSNIGHGRVDLIIDNNLIVELKAVNIFNSETGGIQIQNYMKHYNIQSGLIINFGQKYSGDLNIRYICNDKGIMRIYNFVNGTFVENVGVEMTI